VGKGWGSEKGRGGRRVSGSGEKERRRRRGWSFADGARGGEKEKDKGKKGDMWRVGMG
jgi:hypothetical protein